jgi:hypothetical protein
MSLKKESALPVPVTAQGAKQHIFKGRHTGSVSLEKSGEQQSDKTGGIQHIGPLTMTKSPPHHVIMV